MARQNRESSPASEPWRRVLATHSPPARHGEGYSLPSSPPARFHSPWRVMNFWKTQEHEYSPWRVQYSPQRAHPEVDALLSGFHENHPKTMFQRL
ncbi:hypothetical protein P8452_09069 [Trifolium repens]|nr:hypothetical protein QL285_086586 [Trifolium repens]WJX19363.1 hypothetical protein P8452_09069 [Trifolium repens]